MGNPFEGKFKAFAAALSAKNAQDHADDTAAKSGEVYRDKPFTEEYRTLYRVANVGQTLSQIVTFLTTAALGVFALTHIVPTWWGIYLAVPLGIAFAFGVEKVKRTTLTIASKHLLKYKSFGFVGFAAGLVMCVSILAALYGAKELPGVVYPLPKRTVDMGNVTALNADIQRVQTDIDRLQLGLKTEANWTAENRTLPRLQKTRADLVAKRDEATASAEGRADTEHGEALAERTAKVDKMQVYTVGAAIVAELVFLLCTAFILYYLFRHFAERTPPEQPTPEAGERQPAGFEFYQNGTFTPPPVNEAPRNHARQPIGFHRQADDAMRYRARDNALGYDSPPAGEKVTEVDKSLKPCAQCGELFRPRTTWQKFCRQDCKLAHHEAKHGAKFEPKQYRAAKR